MFQPRGRHCHPHRHRHRHRHSPSAKLGRSHPPAGSWLGRSQRRVRGASAASHKTWKSMGFGRDHAADVDGWSPCSTAAESLLGLNIPETCVTHVPVLHHENTGNDRSSYPAITVIFIGQRMAFSLASALTYDLRTLNWGVAQSSYEGEEHWLDYFSKVAHR